MRNVFSEEISRRGEGILVNLQIRKASAIIAEGIDVAAVEWIKPSHHASQNRNYRVRSRALNEAQRWR